MPKDWSLSVFMETSAASGTFGTSYIDILCSSELSSSANLHNRSPNSKRETLSLPPKLMTSFLIDSFNNLFIIRLASHNDSGVRYRSEERRVGKECRSRW